MNKKIEQKIKYDKKESERLDLFLMEKLGKTRSQIQKYIKEGLIFVNHISEKSKFLLKEGDEVEIIPVEVRKVSKPKIIFEDKDILVIDKPSGISVHPAPGEKDKTVTEIFKSKFKFPEKAVNPGVVHRLDKGTSGVMILAKNQKIRTKLQKEFANRNVKKTYVALIEGHIHPHDGIINLAITRNTSKREKMTVTSEGKDAVTSYRLVKKYHNYSLVEAMPKTGRTHQIRIHFSSIGYPIVGDLKYGRKKDLINRIFLHAKKIEFRHPVTEELMTFETEMPEELKELLNQLY